MPFSGASHSQFGTWSDLKFPMYRPAERMNLLQLWVEIPNIFCPGSHIVSCHLISWITYMLEWFLDECQRRIAKGEKDCDSGVEVKLIAGSGVEQDWTSALHFLLT